MRTVRNGRRALKVRREAALVRKERELTLDVDLGPKAEASRKQRLQKEIAVLKERT